jgi:hypothetical protein
MRGGRWRWLPWGAGAVVGTGLVVAFAMAVVALPQLTSPSERTQALLAVAQAGSGLLLAGITAFYAHSTRAMAREMEREGAAREAQAREAQAHRVWARLDRLDDEAHAAGYMEATIHNTSQEPIAHAVLRLLDWSWRSERRVISTRVYEFIAPGEYGERIDVGPIGPVPDWATSSRPPIEIHFTDAAGVNWRRDPDGRLVEIR